MTISTKSNPIAKLPRLAILVGAVALFQVIRIMAFTMVQDVLAGKTPDAWLFPASTDVFVGVMAIVVALALWTRRGLAVWTLAIVFFCISISDHLDAITVVLNTRGPLPAMMSGAPSSTATMLTVMILIEVAAIGVLIWQPVRDYYLTPKTSPALQPAAARP
jgi:hypothetical protein